MILSLLLTELERLDREAPAGPFKFEPKMLINHDSMVTVIPSGLWHLKDALGCLIAMNIPNLDFVRWFINSRTIIQESLTHLKAQEERMKELEGKCKKCDGLGWYIDSYGETPQQTQCEECGGSGISARIVQLENELAHYAGWQTLADQSGEIKKLQTLTQALYEKGKREHRNDEAHVCYSFGNMPSDNFVKGVGYPGSSYCDCGADTFNAELDRLMGGEK